MILITGGLGYLGGRIAAELLSQGVSVRVGTSRDVERLPPELADAELVKYSIDDIDSLRNACRGCDTVVHLAAMNAGQCSNDPRKALIVNGLGTWNVLSAAHFESVDRALYFSTAHVYGSPLAGRITEETLPRPTHPYSITHRTAEDYVLEFSEKGGPKGTVFRLSNGSGSPIVKTADCWMLIINDLCRQVIESGTITVHANPLAERDFIAVTDIARTVHRFVAKTDQALAGEIFNVSSGESLTLEAAAVKVQEQAGRILGETPDLVFKKQRTNLTTPSLRIDNQKAVDAGLLVSEGLDDEIKRLLESCQKWFA